MAASRLHEVASAVIWVATFVALTLVFRLLFVVPSHPVRVRQLTHMPMPLTVGEVLRSDIPITWEMARVTQDEGSCATLMNSAAARLHALSAPIHPAVRDL